MFVFIVVVRRNANRNFFLALSLSRSKMKIEALSIFLSVFRFCYLFPTWPLYYYCCLLVMEKCAFAVNIARAIVMTIFACSLLFNTSCIYKYIHYKRHNGRYSIWIMSFTHDHSMAKILERKIKRKVSFALPYRLKYIHTATQPHSYTHKYTRSRFPTKLLMNGWLLGDVDFSLRYNELKKI